MTGLSGALGEEVLSLKTNVADSMNCVNSFNSNFITVQNIDGVAILKTCNLGSKRLVIL